MAGLGADYRPLPALALRAGLAGYLFCWQACDASMGGFVGASGLVGRRQHKFEAGLEYSHFMGDSDTRFLSPLIGYRLQPETSGFFMRAVLQAMIRANMDGDVLPFPGVSLGYTR